MNVPLLDLKVQYKSLKKEILAAVSEVLDSQVCILGPKVAELEQAVAKISDCRFGVGVSSGTDALLAALMALGIGPGDEVVTTPFTFFATAGCVARVGARPVFVDINPRTYNIDPEKIERAITAKTKAIIPVHLYGQMCEMDPIMEIARKHNLYVIEDAAQAISATYKGRTAGSIGTVGCFSFFPSKNLGAAGDGGTIVTNDENLYEKLVMMRAHGARARYYHRYVGGNFRLDALQASVLLVKIPHLNKWSEMRRRNAAMYDNLFSGSAIVTPWIHEDTVNIYNQYVIRAPERDGLMEYLKSIGVGCEIYYPIPLHLQECFSDLGYQAGGFPEAERAAKEVIALPIYPELSEDQIHYVGEAVLRWSSAN